MLRTKSVVRAGMMAATVLLVTAVSTISADAEQAPVGDIRPAGTANVVADSYVVVLKNTVSMQQRGVTATMKSLTSSYGGKVGHTFQHALQGFEITTNEALAKRIAADPAVDYVQRNGIYKADDIQVGPPSWGLDRIDQGPRPLDGSYTFPSTASNVHAYILDSGIRLSHSDFGGRAEGGYDAVTPGGNASDCNGHGTHVAGTVGGNTYGTAKGVTLVAVRVLNCNGSGELANVLAGIEWVTANAVKPAVANMSLGGPANSTLDTAVNNSINAGITYTLSAGNGDADGNPLDACGNSPARVPAAITVAATDITDRRADFSNYGNCVDIFAPGVDITSSWWNSDTARNTIDGTSMAAPHVAGAAALALSANPTWTPAQVREYLVNTTATANVVSDTLGSPNKLLRVTSPAPANNFALGLSATNRSVTQGGSTTTTVTTSLLSGSSQSVALTAATVPAGVSVSFSPSSVTVGGSSTVTVSTTASTPSGYYSIVIVGTGNGGATRTGLLSLTVISADQSGKYVAVPGSRILDTRTGAGAPVGKIGPGGTLRLQVTGRGNIPASGVTAVVLNVTVANGTSGSYLTVYPAGVTRPTASNLNFTAGWVGANAVTVPVSADGKVDIYNALGNVDVIADTLGYYTSGNGGSGGLYHRFSPDRLIDTREIPGLRLGGGETLQLGIAAGSLPESDKHIKALSINVTAVNPDWFGYLTAYDGVSAVPNASTLNFNKGQVVPNFTIVPTAPCPPGESWCSGLAIFGVYNGSAYATDFIVDVFGFYDDGTMVEGLQFHPVTPTRIADTRTGSGLPGALGQNTTTNATTPAALRGANTYGLVANVTGILPTRGTYLSLWAAGFATPPVSNLNLVAGEVRPNAAVINLNADWAYSVYNAQGSTHVAIDVSGTFDSAVFGASSGTGVGARSGDTQHRAIVRVNK